MSTVAVVDISPATTTKPVVTRVSQATLPLGSVARTASRTASEIWSATLSGCPSVTDSLVNVNLLSMVHPLRPVRGGHGHGHLGVSAGHAASGDVHADTG